MSEVVASIVTSGATTPTLSITRETNGDVTITFTGTLLTSTNLNGWFPAAGNFVRTVATAMVVRGDQSMFCRTM